MALNDLFQALQIFQNGVKEAATYSAVNDATKQMQGIQQSAADDAQKRQQLQQLSNETALRLTGVGANGQQIQSAFNAIAPANFGSAEQLQLEGSLSGNQQYTQQANRIISDRDQKRAKAEELDFNRKLQLQDREMAHQTNLASIKEGGKASVVIPGYELAPGVKPTDKDLEALKLGAESFSNLNGSLKSLDKMVDKSGTEAFTVPVFGGADKKLLEQTKTSMVLQLKEMEKLGALAGPDVDVLEKMMPDPTAYRTAQYKSASANFKKELEQRINNKAMSRGARFVGFAEEEKAAGPTPQVRTLKDGSKVKVIQLQDGKWQVVD